MMSDLKPALTEEEWEGHQTPVGWIEGGCKWSRRDPDIDKTEQEWYQEALHGAAALCLHGQDFGFTWEDVKLLRRSADEHLSIHGGYSPWGESLQDLADRIAALLPPRE